MNISDNQWLGEQESMGPFVRAGLGILLARGDWTWWYHPGATSTIMLDSISVSGVAEWGGDAAVLAAQEWLDLNIALEVAQAFRTLLARRSGDLRLKIQRAVYSWDAAPSVNVICDDLARAFTRERIFVDWPTDRRPRRALASSQNQVNITSTDFLSEITTSLIKSLSGAKRCSPNEHATIAVVTLDELLKNNFSSTLLIILGTSRESVIPHLDAIRMVSGAQCAIFLPSDQSNIARWLEVFGNHIAEKSVVDLALIEANKEIAKPAFFLASTQTFMIHSSRKFFSHAVERAENSELPESPSSVKSVRPTRTIRHRSKPLPNLEIAGVKMEAAPPTIRVMHARVERDGNPVVDFPLSGKVEIRINIQPVSPLTRHATAFPDHNLEWHGNEKILQVHLLEAGFEPKTTSLILPRVGASTPAIFSHTIRPDNTIDLRFVVSEGICILQTARMQGFPGTSIEFLVEAVNSSVDQKKASFDIAMLMNDASDNKSSVTLLTDEGIHLASLEYRGLMSSRDELRRILDACLDPEISFSSSLFNLANSGKILLNELKDLTPDWPMTINRIQLTTPSNEHFPIEYLYDGETPDNEDAPLCNNRVGCLSAGNAIEMCEIRAGRQQLCPMGFLGITSVIERHIWDKSMGKTLWLRQMTDLTKRNQISDLQRVLFAASNRADEFEEQHVPEKFDITRTADVETLIKGIRKYNWRDWSDAIATIRPKLLVLLPHIENNHLYIGDEKKLAFASLRRTHIGNSEPVVIVIGCNSAIGLTSNTGLPAIFLREGAKVVIASLADVLGRFANIAAADLARKLISASMGKSLITIGELITSLRREFLAKDNALGMVLIAFGDADCCLGEKIA